MIWKSIEPQTKVELVPVPAESAGVSVGITGDGKIALTITTKDGHTMTSYMTEAGVIKLIKMLGATIDGPIP